MRDGVKCFLKVKKDAIYERVVIDDVKEVVSRKEAGFHKSNISWIRVDAYRSYFQGRLLGRSILHVLAVYKECWLIWWVYRFRGWISTLLQNWYHPPRITVLRKLGTLQRLSKYLWQDYWWISVYFRNTAVISSVPGEEDCFSACVSLAIPIQSTWLDPSYKRSHRRLGGNAWCIIWKWGKKAVLKNNTALNAWYDITFLIA